MAFPIQNDVVFVDSLQVSANIGCDCWSKCRIQPALISVYVHLRESFLTRAGQSDDVRDSIHYGHLSKAIATLVAERDTPFDGPGELVEGVTEEAFRLAGDAAVEVRVVVDLPKMILLAAGFSVDVTTPAGTRSRDAPTKVSVKDLILPTIIGVNPPEREARQRVITNIIFFQNSGSCSPIDYPQIISNISKDIEASSYLTLEKFVGEIVRTACLSSDALQAVTVRAQKPSAISFAHSSGVEITRHRLAFLPTSPNPAQNV